MKNIQFFNAEKYSFPDYESVEDCIFQQNGYYVTSLSFEQEPECDEGTDASDISQYPLEDILDRFNVFISDFYPQKNLHGSATCYLEFSGKMEKDIRALLEIIGHRVVNRQVFVDGQTYIDLGVE